MFQDHTHVHPMGPTVGPAMSIAMTPLIPACASLDTFLETLGAPDNLDAIMSSYVASN